MKKKTAIVDKPTIQRTVSDPPPLYVHDKCGRRETCEQAHLFFPDHTQLYCLYCKEIVNFEHLVDRMAFRLSRLLGEGMPLLEARRFLALQHLTEQQAAALRKGGKAA